MPRWLVTVLLLLLFFVFVVPDPAGAGNATGTALRAMGRFFQSAAAALSGTVAPNASPGSLTVYPNGGVASGDGTTHGSAAPSPGPGSTPVSGTVTALGPDAAMSYSQPVTLRIPSIGMTSGFAAVGLTANGFLEVPPAADVVGWYTGAPTPGELGPAVVTAHVDWKQQKGVFHDLGRLRPGDEVAVDRADGVPVTFGVTRVAEYPKTQFPTGEVYGSVDAPELRLITCGGRFNSATRSYDDNIVVFASMVGVG
ncbi:MAG: hypothetical protein QOI51_2236 [Nocardioidaceae bacterium]|nr:hypothetical protein [Nocardioidaceae bacterium]